MSSTRSEMGTERDLGKNWEIFAWFTSAGLVFGAVLVSIALLTDHYAVPNWLAVTTLGEIVIGRMIIGRFF